MVRITIAIDWHTWTWKWTTSKGVAKRLWYKYLDTWAMYRAIALYAMRHDLLDASDEEISGILDKISMDFELNLKTGHHDMILNGENVEKEIRETSLWLVMRPVVKCIPLREKLVVMQSQFGKAWWIVCDWRDIWTHVFPDAELKIFLTCDLDVRVERRIKQLEWQWLDVDFNKIRADIQRRDSTDYLSEDAVNKKAEDAIIIDTTHCTIEEQINRVVSLAQEKIEAL